MSNDGFGLNTDHGSSTHSEHYGHLRFGVELVHLAVVFQRVLETGDRDLLLRFWDAYDGPIRRGGEILFVTRARPGETLWLKGDFTGSELDLEMKVTPMDKTFLYAIVQVDHNDPFYYWFFSDSPYADPHTRWMSFERGPLVSVVFGEGKGRITSMVVPSPGLGNPERNIYLYLPAVCFDPGARVPAVYMQDGDNLFRGSPTAPFGTWNLRERLDEAIEEGLVAPLAIIGITTRNRSDEYLHANNLWGDNQVGRLSEYTEYVIQTLIPLMEEGFPLAHGCENRAVAGSSFGGTSAFLMAWRNPHVFSKVAAFSPSTATGRAYQGSVDRSLLAMISHTDPLPELRIYLDSGDSDHDGARTYASDCRAFTDHLRNWLILHGWDGRPEYNAGDRRTPVDYPPETSTQAVPTLYWSKTTPAGYHDYQDYLQIYKNLLHIVGKNHKHNEDAWSQRATTAFAFLFPAHNNIA